MSLLTLSDFNLNYGERSLFQNLNLSLKKGDKIGLIGSNGSGKTTLIQTLTAEKIFETKTKNSVSKLWRNDNFSYQILTQNYQEILDLEITLEQNLAVQTNLSSSEIRLQLANFLFFTKPEVSRKAGNLSGGEKARLALAILTAKNCDLLILDEPTNNLDIQTLDFFVEALKVYPGSVLIISHDEGFLGKLELNSQYQICNQELVLEIVKN